MNQGTLAEIKQWNKEIRNISVKTTVGKIISKV